MAFRKVDLMKSYQTISITTSPSSSITIPVKVTNVANCMLIQGSKTHFLNGWDAALRHLKSTTYIKQVSS